MPVQATRFQADLTQSSAQLFLQPMSADIDAEQLIYSRNADAALADVDALMLKLVTAGSVGDAKLSVATNSLSIAVAPSNAAAAGAYHLKSAGQKVRTRLTLFASQCLGLSSRDGIALAAAVELLHNASLIHDDLQDRDTMRRDQATVWVKFGDEIAICAGDLLLSAAYCALAGISAARINALPEALKLMHARIGTAVRGQCADFCSAKDTLPSVDDYKKIAIAKSGALLSLPLELPLLIAGRLDALPIARDAANAFAVGYQIIDDLADIHKDLNRKNKNTESNPSQLSQAEKAANSAANIVLILQALAKAQSNSAIHDCQDSIALAQALGREQLMLATTASAALPNHVGQLMQTFIQKMIGQLAVAHPVAR